MKIVGKNLTFNGKNIYHGGNKLVASDVLFTDGKTLQQKLDDGSLKGKKEILVHLILLQFLIH